MELLASVAFWLLFALGLLLIVIYIGLSIFGVRLNPSRITPPQLIGWLVCTTVFSVVAGYMTLWTFFGAFGPGAWFALLCVAGSIAVIVWALAKLLWLLRNPATRSTYVLGTHLLITVGLLMMQGAAPLLGAWQLPAWCNGQARHAAQPLINATQRYHADNQRYPESVEALVPNYTNESALKVGFPLSCQPLLGLHTQYQLEHCTDEDPPVALIAFLSVNGMNEQRYDLDRGKWDAMDFLDGACSFLDP